MFRVSVNDLAALMLVLSNMSTRELLKCAVAGLGTSETAQAQSKADICTQALNTYLNQ